MSVISTKLRLVINNLSKINLRAKQIIRHGGYYSSEYLEDLGKVSTKFEVTKDPVDWKCVENILPRKTIPEPVKKDEYPSGWQPQADDMQSRPYYIERTRNHLIPVYLDLAQHNIRRHTIIRRVKGDIWLLEKEVTEFLQTLSNKPIRLQVNEFAGFIRINGDFVNAIKYWLKNKGY
ncbi:unnamed protein product [Brassicogethes aeneus]|uniref:Large ribosomal subunit protein mL49 n=1 Tax=Brassicogethes aeneus TaxID=1431903 RepID=A0A9P0BE46_BRAAE|nr:unnamed protein product [Brassicogethes aeneus]